MTQKSPDRDTTIEDIHATRPALKQGRIEGSDFPKPIFFSGDTANQQSLPGSQPDGASRGQISTPVDSRSRPRLGGYETSARTYSGIGFVTPFRIGYARSQPHRATASAPPAARGRTNKQPRNARCATCRPQASGRPRPSHSQDSRRLRDAGLRGDPPHRCRSRRGPNP